MERRKYERIPVAVPIRARINDIDEFAQQNSIDLSEGGIFIQTRRRHRIGSQVYLEFHLESERKRIPARGVVVRRVPATFPGDSQAGVAIKFTELDGVAKDFIELTIRNWNLHHPSQVLDIPSIFADDPDDDTRTTTKAR